MLRKHKDKSDAVPDLKMPGDSSSSGRCQIPIPKDSLSPHAIGLTNGLPADTVAVGSSTWAQLTDLYTSRLENAKAGFLEVAWSQAVWGRVLNSLGRQWKQMSTWAHCVRKAVTLHTASKGTRRGTRLGSKPCFHYSINMLLDLRKFQFCL